MADKTPQSRETSEQLVASLMQSSLEDDEIDEDTEWELSQGIPQPSDEVVEKYFQGRDALIQQEDKHRSDLAFRESLSPMASEACSIASAIRFGEEQTLWGVDEGSGTAYGTTKDGHDVYPGMLFQLARSRIDQSKMYQIIRKMPKGALLHCHLEAMLDYHWFFDMVLKTPGMHISTSYPILSVADGEKAELSFKYFSKSPNPDSPSIFADTYTPDTFVPMTVAAATYPGGATPFVDFLTSKVSLSVQDSLDSHQSSDAIWRKFVGCFMRLRSVIFYEPIYRAYLSKLFHTLAEDNIQYIEIRHPSAYRFTLEGSEETLDQMETWRNAARIFTDEIKKFQATPAGKNFWGARIIWNALRGISNREIHESMNGCIELKKEHPALIAGFDLVGQEDMGRPLADLLPILLWFKKACAQRGVNIPLLLHAGETNQSGGHADMNLFDALLLGSRRIGHGFSLFKHPLLMGMVRDRRVCVECCPISNEILRLTTNAYSHPLPAMLAHGVPIALSNDDPGVLHCGNAGLSYDYFQAMQGAESMGLEGLGAVAENSVRYSCFEDEDNKSWTENIKEGAYGKTIKAERMKEWKKAWEKFCQWVVVEFGVDMNLDPDE